MKKWKFFWVTIYIFGLLWNFYQISILPAGYQRYFLIFLVFVFIALILVEVFNLKPLFGNKK